MLPDYYTSADALLNTQLALASMEARRALEPARPVLTPVAVVLPGGFTWRLRALPRAKELATAKRRLVKNGPNDQFWSALFAAYDDGWDVWDDAGQAVPSPRRLSVRGYERVPRATLIGLVEWLAAQVAAVLIARVETDAAVGLAVGAQP